MTNKVYLDANVLISHQVSEHKYHLRAVKILDELWEKQTILVVSSLTLDEVFYGIIFILQQFQKDKKGVPFSSYAQILEKVIGNILSWNKLELVEFRNNPVELLETIKIIKKYNFRPRDAFHLRIAEQNEIQKIATFDLDFACLENAGIKIIS